MSEQIGRQSRRDIIFQDLEGHRKVELELTLDFIGQLGPSIHRVASTFVESGQLTGQLIIRLPGFEPIAMAHQQFTEQIGVGLIIFGAATEEGFSIISNDRPEVIFKRSSKRRTFTGIGLPRHGEWRFAQNSPENVFDLCVVIGPVQ
jgi:hypothetical protein